MIFNFFGVIMWLGLGTALYIALMPVFGMDWYPTLLLEISLGHMILLSIIAWVQVWRKTADNVDIGSRVATTGYIHTLIGTCAALVAAAGFDGGNLNEIQQIIKPIGAALGTSIIGWWMGNEIQLASLNKTDEGLISYRNKEQVEKSLEELASSVRNLSLKLTESGVHWENSADNIRRKFENASDDMVKKWQDTVNNVLKKLDGASDDIVKEWQTSVKNVETQLNTASGVLVKACHALNKKLEEIRTIGLSTATSTVSELSTQIENTLKEAKTQLDLFKSSAKSIADESTKTSTSMKTISSGAKTTADKFQEVNKSLENISKIIEEADKLLAQLRKEREERK